MSTNTQLLPSEKTTFIKNAASQAPLFDLRRFITELGIKKGQLLEQKGFYLAIRICPDMPRFFQGDTLQINELLNSEDTATKNPTTAKPLTSNIETKKALLAAIKPCQPTKGVSNVGLE